MSDIPRTGNARFVVHGNSTDILRGSFAEFRHAGVPITIHPEIVGALADLAAHDPAVRRRQGRRS